MIYAELAYPGHYSDYHDDLLQCLQERFAHIEHGHQGDSWMWIFSGEDKVAIDTFYSMQHQVKSESGNVAFVEQVIEQLKLRFDVTILDTPAPEPHED